jgi:hypothetical protein
LLGDACAEDGGMKTLELHAAVEICAKAERKNQTIHEITRNNTKRLFRLV